MFKRNWSTSMIKAQLAEPTNGGWPHVSKDVVDQYRETLLASWHAQLLCLPVPILTASADIVDVMEIGPLRERARIYPPFELNKVAESAALFNDVQVPEGLLRITHSVPIDNSAVRGMVSSQTYSIETSFCHGLRFDLKEGTNSNWLLNSLLDHICQQTGQWWLRGRTNPLSGAVRMSCELNKNFTLRNVLKVAGAKTIPSPWIGIEQRLAPLGIEQPLTNSVWLRCCHDVSAGLRADHSLLAYYDAINNYMNNEDELCVMNLAIAVEIMGNKHRLARGKHPAAFQKILQSSELIPRADRALIQKLYADRNHVAHGAPMANLGQPNGPAIENYLEAVTRVKSSYLQNFAPGEWHKFSQVDITLARKR